MENLVKSLEILGFFSSDNNGSITFLSKKTGRKYKVPSNKEKLEEFLRKVYNRPGVYIQ
jgi:predicted RNA binding protein YcfA (HicA-like mRNA interferase family)